MFTINIGNLSVFGREKILLDIDAIWIDMFEKYTILMKKDTRNTNYPKLEYDVSSHHK